MLEDTRASDLTRLLGYLASAPDPLVRWRACRAFARLQDSTAVPGLLDALAGDPDVAVRREAAFALGQVGSRQATLALGVAAREQPDLAVRARAIEALGKLGDPRGTGPVAAHLTHPEAELSREAAIALWRLGDSTAVQPLAEALQSKDAWTRAFCAYALEKTPVPRITIKALSRRVGDDAPAVRAYVARALGRQRSKDALGPLLTLAGDRDPVVRISAVRGLGALADSAALPQVLAALGDADPHVRETAAAAAQALGSRDALPGLRTALDDRDGGVRLAAVRALAALSPETATRDLAERLADAERFVRAGVFETLGRVPDPEALLTVKRVAAGIRPVGGSASAEERAGAFSGLAAVPGRREGRDEIVAGLSDGHWLVAAAAAEAAGASGDSTLVPELTRLLRANPDPKEVDVPLSVLSAIATLGPAAARGSGVPGLRAALDSVLADPDPRVRDAAGRAYAAAFGDSALAAARAARPAPPWREGALADYRAALAEQDSTGAVGRVRGAVMKTARGEIELALFPREAPLTVRNFVTLAERGYFDRLRFHRVVPYFVIQDGDPSGTGAGGPGYAFRCEYNRLRYDTGALGMALSGKDTGGSQWFVTHGPQPHLDGRYTIFGHVVRGQDVVDRIRRGDAIEKVTILRR
jgi:cyclophilin family peptidyl-prolyl cis-trans isomerase/HEAT repeat protein